MAIRKTGSGRVTGIEPTAEPETETETEHDSGPGWKTVRVDDFLGHPETDTSRQQSALSQDDD